MNEIEKANTFSRMELMREKTRSAGGLNLPDQYDHMALDWVYSDRIEWEGSMPDRLLNRWKEYEARKEELRKRDLSDEEYQKAIADLVQELGI